MPIFEQSSHGDLFVEYNVVLPIELDPELRRSESRYVFHDYFNYDTSWLDLTTVLELFRASGSFSLVRTSREGRIIDCHP
jgi:hypothetical protein